MYVLVLVMCTLSAMNGTSTCTCILVITYRATSIFSRDKFFFKDNVSTDLLQVNTGQGPEERPARSLNYCSQNVFEEKIVDPCEKSISC